MMLCISRDCGYVIVILCMYTHVKQALYMYRPLWLMRGTVEILATKKSEEIKLVKM